MQIGNKYSTQKQSEKPRWINELASYAQQGTACLVNERFRDVQEICG